MHKVYISWDVNSVYFARSILKYNKIDSVVLREMLSGAVGGLVQLDT